MATDEIDDHYVLVDLGGKQMSCSPLEQTRLCATLANNRILNKVQLDAVFNAVLMIRLWMGKAARSSRR